VGQCYYNNWYLSRELRKLGWKADVLNIDRNPNNQIYYHGEDFRFYYGGFKDFIRHILFYLKAIRNYDIFHFSNANGIYFSNYISKILRRLGLEYLEIKILKKLGKKIVYSNNGCLDGVSQTSFSSWGSEAVCDICPWKNEPSVCSDEKNLKWGKVRNELTDYQILLGGNRKDYNDDPRVHEVPGFYCLGHEFWNPDMMIPSNYLLPIDKSTIKILHAVGNYDSRTKGKEQKNLKSTHIYLPLIEDLKREGHDVELIFFKDIPNKVFRYYQAQADIVVDMLTYGFFGANIREAMMLGKPCICFLRPEWLESMKVEIPEYVKELPVISATPDTIREILIDLIVSEEKRKEIGKKSREFAIKWHSSESGARQMGKIYLKLIKNNK
jgi:glycosyltransferase involved in cell wall biosynthesis